MQSLTAVPPTVDIGGVLRSISAVRPSQVPPQRRRSLIVSPPIDHVAGGDGDGASFALAGPRAGSRSADSPSADAPEHAARLRVNRVRWLSDAPGSHSIQQAALRLTPRWSDKSQLLSTTSLPDGHNHSSVLTWQIRYTNSRYDANERPPTVVCDKHYKQINTDEQNNSICLPNSLSSSML